MGRRPVAHRRSRPDAAPRRDPRQGSAVVRARRDIDFEWHGKHYHREITRELFENLIKDIVDRTLGPCRDCMKDAGVTPEQIDEVVHGRRIDAHSAGAQRGRSAVPRQAAHRTESR